jgi:hypothetical protein
VKLRRSAVKFGISNLTAELRSMAQRHNLSLVLYFGFRFIAAHFDTVKFALIR